MYNGFVERYSVQIVKFTVKVTSSVTYGIWEVFANQDSVVFLAVFVEDLKQNRPDLNTGPKPTRISQLFTSKILRFRNFKNSLQYNTYTTACKNINPSNLSPKN
jgi:hypothetical protein